MALVLFFYLLAGLLTLASGKPILLPRLAQEAAQPSPSFDVHLEALGNTTVKAHVTNLGADGVRIVQRGGVLDKAPTKKVTVTGGDSDPTFTGVRVEYVLSHLTGDGFVEVSPNQTIASVFDIADFYDLTPGQEYTAISNDHIEYTTLLDEKKFLTYRYKSNNITFTAPTDVKNRLQERSTLECSGEYNDLVQNAISRAAEMATAAAKDARTGSDLLKKFFKSTDESVINEVAGRLDAIAKEATTTGQLTYYCQPTSEDYCAGNVAAMTYPTLNRVVNCPGYYESTKVSNYCGYLDQAGITLHEYSHATALYSPGTEDVAYGYDSVLSLDTQDSLNNADNFAYYASAVYLQCSADDSTTIGNPIDGSGSGDSSDDGTGTSTQMPTYTPVITPGTGTGTGSGWPWPWGGSGDGTSSSGSSSDTSGTGGWGWGQNDDGSDYTSADSSGSDTGIDSTSGGWGKSPDTGSSTATATGSAQTTAPVTTSNGQDLYNLQDLVDWLMSMYAGQKEAATATSTAEANSQAGSQTGNEQPATTVVSTAAQGEQADEEDEDCDEDE
ncbi:Deuterolysin metalloprotease family-domain-containing protein [Aspergillus unguis]